MSQTEDVKCAFHSSCQRGCSHLKDATLLGLILYLAQQRFLSTMRWGKRAPEMACTYVHMLHLMHHRLRQLLYKSALCCWTAYCRCLLSEWLFSQISYALAIWHLVSDCCVSMSHCDLQNSKLTIIVSTGFPSPWCAMQYKVETEITAARVSLFLLSSNKEQYASCW